MCYHTFKGCIFMFFSWWFRFSCFHYYSAKKFWGKLFRKGCLVEHLVRRLLLAWVNLLLYHMFIFRIHHYDAAFLVQGVYSMMMEISYYFHQQKIRCYYRIEITLSWFWCMSTDIWFFILFLIPFTFCCRFSHGKLLPLLPWLLLSVIQLEKALFSLLDFH